MDKSQINQIAENLSEAEQVPDVVFQLTEDCKLLLEELERQHKADQKAVEEANQLAETYMKRCQGLYDELKNKDKFQERLSSHIVDAVNRLTETKVIIKTEKASLKDFSTDQLVDELRKRGGVYCDHVNAWEETCFTSDGVILLVCDK